MLLPQTSLHRQSHLFIKPRIASTSVKVFCLPHRQGRLRLLPGNCFKGTLQSLARRRGNQGLQKSKISDFNYIDMRIVNALLAMDMGKKCTASKPAGNYAALTNSLNQAALNTANTLGGDSSCENVDAEETEEKQRQEAERLRRKKISEAKKGTVPWNKGRKGKCKTHDEVSAANLKVVKQISQEERENLRRERISEANRGKVPWNKGKKHSPETKYRIRETVIERMKDPMIREKLRLQAQAVTVSPEIKSKIRSGIIRAWNEKKRIRARQERFVKEWQEMVAETARVGCEGDKVYEWDSYSTIKKKLQLAWQPSVKQKKKSVHIANHSMEHRLRISAAIKAKWTDPNYRISVQKGVDAFRMNQGLPQNTSVSKQTPNMTKIIRKPINNHRANYLKATYPRASNLSTEREYASEMLEPVLYKRSLELSPYKDPEVDKKLEKLMSMRVRRIHAEAKKQKDITERARALIVQAGEAAKALEAAAVKDKNALAPLLETRRLLAEAVSSLESMNQKKASLESIKGVSSLYTHVLSLANASSDPKGQGDIDMEQGSKLERCSLHTFVELNER